MVNNKQVFFALVRAGLWDQEVRFETSEEIDLNIIYQYAEEQSVVGLVAAGFNNVIDFVFSQESAMRFVSFALQLEKRNIKMNAFIGSLIEKLKNHDICAILLKGQGIAQSYIRPLCRAPGDVDLFLGETDYQKAAAFLAPMASKIDKEIKFNKHLAMNIDGWEVELHGSLRGGLWDSIDQVLDKIQRAILLDGHVRSWLDGGVQIFLPHADEDIIYVFAHILEHFFCGGVGLRQICDWCRLIWTYRDDLDKSLLASRIKEMGVMTEWIAFGSYAVDYLGMPAEAMPFYSSNRYWRGKARMIGSFIMKVGNFGHNRDYSYFERESYVNRKAISFWRHTMDSVTYLRIFPIDSMKLWWKMLKQGIVGVLEGR